MIKNNLERAKKLAAHYKNNPEYRSAYADLFGFTVSDYIDALKKCDNENEVFSVMHSMVQKDQNLFIENEIYLILLNFFREENKKLAEEVRYQKMQKNSFWVI